MLRSLALLFALSSAALMPAAGQALDDYVRVDTIGVIDIPGFDINTAITYVDDEGIYLYPSAAYRAGDSLVLCFLPHNGEGYTTITLSLPERIRVNTKSILWDFAVTDRHIVLLTAQRLLVYDRKLGAERLECTQDYPITHPYQSVRLLGNRCFLSACAYLGDVMVAGNTYVGLVDLTARKFLWEKQPADPEGSIFMFFRPRSIIDCSGRDIVISDVTRYRIDVYDMKMKHSQTLERSPAAWAYANDTSYKTVVPAVGEKYHPKQLIDQLQSYKDSRSTMKLVSFVNDSVLLVSWLPTVAVDFVSTKREVTETRYDIWKREQSGWKLFAADLKSAQLHPTDTFSVVGHWPLCYEYMSNQSYLLGLDPIPVTVYGPKNVGDILSDMHMYFLENDLKYSFFLFRLNHERL